MKYELDKIKVYNIYGVIISEVITTFGESVYQRVLVVTPFTETNYYSYEEAFIALEEIIKDSVNVKFSNYEITESIRIRNKKI